MEQIASILQFFNSLQGLISAIGLFIVAVPIITTLIVRRRKSRGSPAVPPNGASAPDVPPVPEKAPSPAKSEQADSDSKVTVQVNITQNQEVQSHLPVWPYAPSSGDGWPIQGQHSTPQVLKPPEAKPNQTEQPADIVKPSHFEGQPTGEAIGEDVEQTPTDESPSRSDLHTEAAPVQKQPHLAPLEEEPQFKNAEEVVDQSVQNTALVTPKLDDSPPSNPSDTSQISKIEESTHLLTDATLPEVIDMTSRVPDTQPSATEIRPETRDLEAAPSSGRLRAQKNNDQWRNLNSALYFASFIVQDARVFLAKYARQSDSQYPFYKEFDIHRILFEYLEGLKNVPSPRGKIQNAAARLNSALNKLDVAWIGGDPRAILFAVPIPFGRPGSETTPQELSRELKQTLRNMRKTAEQLGYSVREESRTDPKHPHRNHIFMLVRTLSPVLEFPETIVEGLDEEDPDEQDGDSFEYAS